MENIAKKTLEELVTWDGIYASSAKGLEGSYYAFFGRDSAEVTNSILQAAKIEGNLQNNELLKRATKGLLKLTQWQGTHDDPQSGMQKGKFPHEVRTDSRFYTHLTTQRIKNGQKSWYVDPQDHFMKNWDSNDSTPFITSVLLRLHEEKMLDIKDEIVMRLRNALEWCIRNINEHKGFAGFSKNDDRHWDGLTNHSWKDSNKSYLLYNGEMPVHPIHDVLVNAHMWEALKRGAGFFSSIDPGFTQTLNFEAQALKTRFNDLENGFLIFDQDTSLYYFAEAKDGAGSRLTNISADPAMALSCYFNNESIIDNKYIPDVVKRVLMPDMFDAQAGVRTYSSLKGPYDEDGGYHRGPNTFWPFVSGRVGEGLNNFQFTKEALSVLTAMTQGVSKFGSCIELFLKNDQDYIRFKEPTSGQLSCTDQAWTAARLYYAAKYLHH
ncbi:MAG: hypothetical protein HYW86_04305 [Candidatus Roizmanbacteria bacterium]|nr:MAG: hypothetical protein HYW86_04305 [Candidatus Roizmanbacteria bacterium]